MTPPIIAYYLPQFHPIPENDRWWGPGFTEWTNVARARRLFPGHYQPRVPADLGFYDLRVPETRQAQADLAREAGVDCFCYWHYWFRGRKLMERPFEEVVRSGQPDFPFCLSWANHSWYAKTWDKSRPDRLLVEQTYGGARDSEAHFRYLLPAFRDRRYQRVGGGLLFGIYDADGFPGAEEHMDTWRRLAREEGLGSFHFFAQAYRPSQIAPLLRRGFDTVLVDYTFMRRSARRWLAWLAYKLRLAPQVIAYRDYMETCLSHFPDTPGTAPQILCSWDHTPRSGRRGYLFSGCRPQQFGELADRLLTLLEGQEHESPFVMVKSWNEWGEGNYMEPDLRYGKGFIRALRAAVDKHR